MANNRVNAIKRCVSGEAFAGGAVAVATPAQAKLEKPNPPFPQQVTWAREHHGLAGWRKISRDMGRMNQG